MRLGLWMATEIKTLLADLKLRRDLLSKTFGCSNWCSVSVDDEADSINDQTRHCIPGKCGACSAAGLDTGNTKQENCS